jgi:hypothetical protein
MKIVREQNSSFTREEQRTIQLMLPETNYVKLKLSAPN